MEFERALFRVHERSVQSEPVRRLRLLAERWLPWLALGLALELAHLHCRYAGGANCLPAALQSAGLWNETAARPSLPEDVLLSLVVVSSAAADPASTSAPLGEGFRLETSGGGDVDEFVGSRLTEGANASRGAAPPLEVYRFAADREVALLMPGVLAEHHFRQYNVSVAEDCLAPSLRLRLGFRYVGGGYAGLMVNEVAYTFRTRGYLERLERGVRAESWSWSTEHFQSFSPEESRWLLGAAARKGSLLLGAVVASALISAATGLFVRVAVDGSAVLMFPMAMLSQRLGSGGTPIGVLTRNFPWVGVHVEVLRRSGWPLAPLFWAHVSFLALQSFSYLACNFAWKIMFYRKSTPDSFEEGIFSLVSLLELFSLIFVRSRRSIVVFPKLVFAALVYLHFYIFCTFYAFYGLALSLCCVACAYAMVYCVNNFEEPALLGDPFAFDTPTAAHPRALYVPQLSPSWTLESAPLWTAFYPPELPESYPQAAMRHVVDEEYAMP